MDEAPPTSLTRPERPYAGLFRPCSGQSRNRGKRDWGICLTQDGIVPWWRHETENGRTALYASHEAAQRAIAKLERGPLPERLASALADRRTARAAHPERVVTTWHSPAGLTCRQCGIEGREAPAYPGPEFRVRVLLPGYDGAEGKVVPWNQWSGQTWHILTDAGQRITWYAEQEGETWERMPGATVDEAAPAPTAIQAKRISAHERAIRRAWAERKARREAERLSDGRHATMMNALGEVNRLRRVADDSAEHYRNRLDDIAALKAKRRRAVLKARELHQRLPAEQRLADQANDRARLAESIAEDHLRMREEVQRVLRATEARLAAAEAENAQLWAEIETLTAPVPALAA